MVCERAFITVFLLLALAGAYAADWQYAGIVGKDRASFFDAADIQYPDKDLVRLWVKDISEKTIKHYFKGKERDRIIDESARRIASGYIPEFLKLESTKSRLPDDFMMQDALATMVSDEIIANMEGVPANTSTYFEIDCKGKRIAPLALIKYRKNGSIAKTQTPQPVKYFYIVPDSSGDWLSMLVCPKN
ncbi:MAG: hypothetical protein WCE58_14200 [Gallionella sp.]